VRGTVAVNELLTIERYSHVMHLVSNITGTLRPDCNAVDLIRAMFLVAPSPAAPKSAAWKSLKNWNPCVACSTDLVAT